MIALVEVVETLRMSEAEIGTDALEEGQSAKVCRHCNTRVRMENRAFRLTLEIEHGVDSKWVMEERDHGLNL